VLKHDLNFDLLPAIDACDIFVRLAKDVDDGFQYRTHLAETYGRARGATLLFCNVSGEREAWEDEAYVRAGLCEFKSLESSARCEHKRASKPGKLPLIRDSRNPLLHLMLLLRHATVHTRTLVTSRHETTVVSKLGGEPHDHTYTTAILDGIDVDQLWARRETRRAYDRVQIESVAAWFLERQCVFGCHEVFGAGVDEYCRELLACY